MKRIVALLLVVGMLLCFTACGGGEKAKVEKLMKEYEETLDDYIDAAKSLDMAKVAELSKDITRLSTELGTAIGELEAKDPDAAEELAEKLVELSNKITDGMTDGK